jgi:hypothetical protein
MKSNNVGQATNANSKPVTRALPNFFIIGAAKSGTTSLHSYLDQHPDVYMPSLKEPHWFSRVAPNREQLVHAVTTEKEYLALFEGHSKQSAAREASPSYLWDAEAPHRIKAANPRAKIVAILRHPVERAYSNYTMDVRDGTQHLPFMEALQQDYQRKVKGWDISHLYVELGFYAEQLQRYLRIFDKSQVKVFLYEDLKKDSQSLLISLLHFLGVDSSYATRIDTTRKYNEHPIPRNRLFRTMLKSSLVRTWGAARVAKPTRYWVRRYLLSKRAEKVPMELEAQHFLALLYRPDIENLQEPIERDMKHWL